MANYVWDFAICFDASAAILRVAEETADLIPLLGRFVFGLRVWRAAISLREQETVRELSGGTSPYELPHRAAEVPTYVYSILI